MIKNNLKNIKESLQKEQVLHKIEKELDFLEPITKLREVNEVDLAISSFRSKKETLSNTLQFFKDIDNFSPQGTQISDCVLETPSYECFKDLATFPDKLYNKGKIERYFITRYKKNLEKWHDTYFKDCVLDEIILAGLLSRELSLGFGDNKTFVDSSMENLPLQMTNYMFLNQNIEKNDEYSPIFSIFKDIYLRNNIISNAKNHTESLSFYEKRIEEESKKGNVLKLLENANLDLKNVDLTIKPAVVGNLFEERFVKDKNLSSRQYKEVISHATCATIFDTLDYLRLPDLNTLSRAFCAKNNLENISKNLEKTLK